MELSPDPVPFVPEIHLHQAPPSVGLWELAGGYSSDEPPPFWAFAWPGGQALARYLLDHPETVAGRRVVDLGSGSGLVAFAAAKAGAVAVEAVDHDPEARAAIVRNAKINTVPSELTVLAEPTGGGADVVLAGDVFYTASVAEQSLGLLRAAASDGARILVGDPDREYLPRKLFRAVARYDVPVRPALEDVPVKPVTIWADHARGRCWGRGR
jgi:predicted nicotinamide N-methyase